MNKDTKYYKNRKLSLISFLRRKNLKLYSQIEEYKNTHRLKPEQKTHLNKLQKNIAQCGSNVLVREAAPGVAEYVSLHSCKNKICFIDNYLIQKKVRRKYINFFEKNKTILVIYLPDVGTFKYITKSNFSKYEAQGYEIYKEAEYDLMHLTLTLPHTETGYKNEKYYFNTIKKLFWLLRKKDSFNSLVYGGEYGIEFTKTANGWNIHLHSLLMTKRVMQSRNKLHKIILKEWNNLTAGASPEKTEISKEHREVILKNTLIDNNFIDTLKPCGALNIYLENIFVKNQNTGKKEHVKTWNSKAMQTAVFETISYHFEPFCFDAEEDKFNIDELAEILPKIYKKSLYGKFGCLWGEKSLNVIIDSDLNKMTAEDTIELMTDIEETADEDDNRELNYFIVEPTFLFVRGQHDNIILTDKAKRQGIDLGKIYLTDAIILYCGYINDKKTIFSTKT